MAILISLHCLKCQKDFEFEVQAKSAIKCPICGSKEGYYTQIGIKIKIIENGTGQLITTRDKKLPH